MKVKPMRKATIRHLGRGRTGHRGFVVPRLEAQGSALTHPDVHATTEVEPSRRLPVPEEKAESAGDEGLDAPLGSELVGDIG
jgi:hypothetical protein